MPEAVDAIAKVPFVAVMATHEGPELDRATVVLPAALWAEAEGTFTNFQRRVQRLKAAVPAPGDARAALGAGRRRPAAARQAARGGHGARGLRARGEGDAGLRAPSTTGRSARRAGRCPRPTADAPAQEARA